MSVQQVELVTNPTPDLSVHQWCARGVRQLSRRNKLSSLPFWIPNDTYKRHQFRIVLLRGVVRGDTELDDPVGVLVEYLPPPIDDGKKSQEQQQHQGSGDGGSLNSVDPGGCKVSVRCLNRLSLASDDRSLDLCEQDTATFSADDRQMGFKELVPAAALNSRDFTGDDGNQLLLQVTIQTGVRTAALMSVAKSTNELASSLWSTLSSLTAQVQTIVRKTMIDVAREEEISNAEAFAAAAAGRELPWSSAPAKWAGRLDKWQALVTDHMVEDEQTFLTGPRPGGLTSNEQVLLTQQGINHRAIMAAESLFDYDRDVHEGLLSCQALRKQRYRLVPQRIKDEDFWRHYFWKVTAVGHCDKDEQVQLLLSVLNAPQCAEKADAAASAAAERPAFFQSVLNAVVDATTRPVTVAEAAAVIKEALEAADLLSEYTADVGSDTDSTNLATSAAASLRGMLLKIDRLLSRRKAPGVQDEVTASLERARGECLARLQEHMDAVEHGGMRGGGPMRTVKEDLPATTATDEPAVPQRDGVLLADACVPPEASTPVPAGPAGGADSDAARRREEEASAPEAPVQPGDDASEEQSPPQRRGATASEPSPSVQATAKGDRVEDDTVAASAKPVGQQQQLGSNPSSVSALQSGAITTSSKAPGGVMDDFPSIDGLDDSPVHQAPRSSEPRASSSSGSAARLEFERMPWEED